jgi:1-acyl-sn-glycerol-3-phosphate acyltransferase
MHSLASPSVYAYSAHVLDAWVRTLYHVRYEGRLPSEQFLLLSKHRSKLDIPLCAVPALDSTGKKPYFIMRRQFCNPLWEWYGGITIIRPQDRNGMSEKDALRYNVRSFGTALSTLAQGNSLILFPEGTRKYDCMGRISLHDNALFNRIRKKLPELPIVLAGSSYGGLKPGSRITVRFSEPFLVRNESNLEERIAQGIARLSGYH